MFVGMDLHKNYLQIAVMNEKGKVLENSRINNNLKQVGRFFDENISDEKVCVVMESSSVWYNIYSYLSEEKHLNVVLSNPVKTRAIASVVCDIIMSTRLGVASKTANVFR
jgi:transposase